MSTTTTRFQFNSYGVAIFAVIFAFLLMLMLDPVAEMTQTPFLLFFGAVVVSAWRGGTRAGLLATGLSALVSNHYFLPPFNSLLLTLEDGVRLFVFVAECFAISFLCGSLRTTNQELDRNLLKLSTSEASLRETNQRITELLDSIIDGFYTLDRQWRFAYVNAKASQYLRRSRQELLGQSIWEVFPNLQGSLVEQNLQRAVAEQAVMVFETFSVVNPDRCFEVHISPLTNGLAVYFQDVTNRRSNEQIQQRHMQMLDLANDSIIIRNLDDDCITYWNQGAERQYGWTKAEVYGQCIHELFQTRFPQPLEVIRQTVLEQGYWSGELTQHKRDGTSIIVNSRWTLQHTPEGVPNAILEINYDITEHKQTEAALRESEERFRLAVRAIDGVVYDWNPQTNQVYRSEGLYRLIGLHPDEIPADRDWWSKRMHPDDFARIQTVMQNTLTGKSDRYEFEYRVRHTNGRWITVWDRGYLIRNEQGQAIRVVGSTADITARKRIEEALEESERLYRAIGETINYGIWVCDPQGRNVYASESFLDLVGLTQHQCSAFGWGDVLHPDELESTIAAWQDCVKSGEFWDREHRFRGVDGNWHSVLARGVPVRDENGEIICWAGINLDISRQKRVEAELRESQERFRALIEHASDAIFIADIEGTYIDVNTSACKLLGYEREELIGKQIVDILPEEDLPRLQATRALLLAGNVHMEEWNLCRKDGTRVAVEVSTKILPDRRWQAFVRDIGDRKRTEAALRQNEERYRYLAESIPQLVWTANEQGALLDVNRRWSEFTGLTLEQVQLEGWEQVVYPNDLPSLFQNWAIAQAQGSYYQAEGRMRRADGVYRWHLHQAIPLKNDQGQVIKWFGTATDIEDQKLLEQQSDRILQQEQAAREEAERANRIKDEFLAVLSHELRSPLNPILGWTRLLRTRKFDAVTIDRALETIERNAKLQTQLIEDLLDVSRILRGKLILNVDAIDLKTIIDAAIGTVRLAAEAKGIQIQTDLNLPEGKVSGDPGRLQQIVWNLLSNAIKFTPDGGRVEVRLERVEGVGAQGRGGEGEESSLPCSSSSPALSSSVPLYYAQITVKDTGKGIHPEFLPYVFEYFRQADSTTTRKFGGLGLGLAIARHLTELHGGTIHVDSPGEGLGATFTVCIPLMSTIPLAPLSVEQNPEVNLNGLTVLVVDDDADLRELAEVTLQQYGARAWVAASAAEALLLLTRHHPDLLISDIGMPKIDGYMLMQQVRKLPPEQGGNIPAIALTAYAGEYDQKQALSAGFQKHIPKPVEPEALARAIATLIQCDI
jgi:PAS domain S-box-containing protein